MSGYPPPGSNPPPYYPYWAPQPHMYPQHPPHHPQPDQNLTYSNHQQPPYPYYMPGTVMIPVPMPPMPVDPPQATYVTNIIYQGESSGPPAADPVQVVDNPGDFTWIPSTATTAQVLSGKAVIGGHEGWDGSPLWVIRAWHNGDLIPGKLSVRHNSASVVYDGREVQVQNIEVLCGSPESLRWLPASNGNVPSGAVAGGTTSSGDTLYVGRARHQLSITPGKIHPSHRCCYIGFASSEVSHKIYDVLTKV